MRATRQASEHAFAGEVEQPQATTSPTDVTLTSTSSPRIARVGAAPEETGLSATRFRMWEAETGRWLSPDPLGVFGGANLNGFNSSPANGLDPLGLCQGKAVRVDEKYEYYYRIMSKADYQTFLCTGRVPATTETFISPTRAFSSNYSGVLVRFQVKPGTTDALRGMGVRAHGQSNAKLFPDLPDVRRGWGNRSALFKKEGDQVNIGLGKGKALDVFNDSIVGFETVGFSP
jgi:RHS repeat-associated protein